MKRRPRDTSRRRKRRSRPTPRWLTKQTDLDEVARNRVMLVLSVLSGEKPVSTAIEESGISRGFYYQLETKAINAMLLAMAPGADGDSSPDATGLHHRIKELEDKLNRAEQAQRRAERLLLVQRKLTTGPVKTRRGRPPKISTADVSTTTSSTSAGRSGWRSSTTRKTKSPRRSASTGPATSTPSATTRTAETTTSTQTPAGADAVP